MLDNPTIIHRMSEDGQLKFEATGDGWMTLSIYRITLTYAGKELTRYLACDNRTRLGEVSILAHETFHVYDIVGVERVDPIGMIYLGGPND